MDEKRLSGGEGIAKRYGKTGTHGRAGIPAGSKQNTAAPYTNAENSLCWSGAVLGVRGGIGSPAEASPPPFPTPGGTFVPRYESGGGGEGGLPASLSGIYRYWKVRGWRGDGPRRQPFC